MPGKTIPDHKVHVYKLRPERNWRTQEGPLTSVWDSEVVPLMKADSHAGVLRRAVGGGTVNSASITASATSTTVITTAARQGRMLTNLRLPTIKGLAGD
jgi:hypothetical protein